MILRRQRHTHHLWRETVTSAAITNPRDRGRVGVEHGKLTLSLCSPSRRTSRPAATTTGSTGFTAADAGGMVLRDNMVEIRPKSHLREGRRAYVTKRKTWESARGAEGDVCLRGVVCAAHDRRSSLTSSVSRRSFFRSNARICRLCARRILSVGTVRTTAKTTAEITLQTGPVRNTRDGMGECQRAPITGGGGSAKARAKGAVWGSCKFTREIYACMPGGAISVCRHLFAFPRQFDILSRAQFDHALIVSIRRTVVAWSWPPHRLPAVVCTPARLSINHDSSNPREKASMVA
jgi:hypothetical protein